MPPKAASFWERWLETSPAGSVMAAEVEPLGSQQVSVIGVVSLIGINRSCIL
jgi:hypothetical protein